MKGMNGGNRGSNRKDVTGGKKTITENENSYGMNDETKTMIE